jgi:CheY-like chemotaxis protein
MDVQMPALDGNEVTRRIRGELGIETLPIVALTAGALVVERQRALDAGMNDFISKPFDPQALIRKVRRVVEEARGEPIPMVLLDSPPTLQDANRKLMPSIDACVVQQMFGDDVKLFKSVLARMLRDYSDLALPTCVSLNDEASRNQLTARVHKLKGSAGMIGATRVMRLAGAAEAALLQGRAVDAVERVLQQLAAALTTLREEAEPYFASQPQSDADAVDAVGVGPDISTPELDELCALLESQNLAAVDKFGALSRSLRDILDAADFDRLQEAIENLDFHRGAKILREIRPVDEHGMETKTG